MKTYTTTDFHHNSSDIFNSATNEPVVLNKYKKPQFVMMNFSEYQEMVKKLNYLTKKNNSNWVNDFKKDNNLDDLFFGDKKNSTKLFKEIIRISCSETGETILQNLASKEISLDIKSLENELGFKVKNEMFFDIVSRRLKTNLNDGGFSSFALFDSISSEDDKVVVKFSNVLNQIK